MNAASPLVTEFLPARDRDSRRLLVALHGLGDSLEGYRWMPAELRLPWLHYLLVNAPDPYFGGYSWYDIYGEAGPGVSRSRALLTALLEELPQRGFAPADTALFGFSQGCLMALETGLRYPQRLAGLIGISGYLHDVPTLLQELSPVASQQRILMTHGTQDPLLPIVPVRRQVQLLQGRGLNLQWHEFAKAHTIAGEEELAVLRQFLTESFAPLS